ncbi:MAG: hypothetical protein OXN25_09455 [Candidatus Poribacteria bacterium]|nr:hypothetical protein [Candidatus Poribacteria bacterium]
MSSHREKDLIPDDSKKEDFSEIDSSEEMVSLPEAEHLTTPNESSNSEKMYLREISESIDIENGDSDEDTSEMLDIVSVDLRPPPGMSLAAWMDSLSPDEKQVVYSQKPWLEPIEEMTLQEVEAEVERRKQRLIEKFGNTPEVQIINKYTTVSHLLGESYTLTGDEIVEHARAMSVLWPTEENIASYRRFKSWQENGWHVDKY